MRESGGGSGWEQDGERGNEQEQAVESELKGEMVRTSGRERNGGAEREGERERERERDARVEGAGGSGRRAGGSGREQEEATGGELGEETVG